MTQKIVQIRIQGNTVIKDPDRVVAERGSKPTIVWTAENEPRIERIIAIHIGDDWRTPQPHEVTPKVWEVLDPNGSKQTYSYEITVRVTGSGNVLTDPEIENEGQNGDQVEPPPGKVKNDL